MNDIVTPVADPFIKKRIDFIDLAKGFCIILVVYYHVHTKVYPPSAIDGSISVFRMPLYFFLSGLFFKTYEGFDGFLKRKINKLLIPFLFFYLITSVLLPNALFYAIGYKVQSEASIGYKSLWNFFTIEEFSNWPLWFLWCLFIVNILFYIGVLLGKKLKGENTLPICIYSFVLGLIGYSLSRLEINLPAFVDSSLTAIPFFCIGFVFNRYTDILRPAKWDRYLPIIIVLLFAFCGIFTYGHPLIDFMRNTYADYSALVLYSCGLAGLLGVIFTAKLIHKLPLVSYWGRYSIMILVTHMPLIPFYIKAFQKLHLDGGVLIATTSIVLLLSYLLFIPLMKKFLPYVTAQKDIIKI